MGWGFSRTRLSGRRILWRFRLAELICVCMYACIQMIFSYSFSILFMHLYWGVQFADCSRTVPYTRVTPLPIHSI